MTAPRFSAADCAAQGHAPDDHDDHAEVAGLVPSPPFTRDMPDLPVRLDPYAPRPLLSYGQLRDRMATEHQQCALEGLCCNDPGASWHGCDYFTLARMRGICHTAYVTITADARFLIVDITTDGPSAACGGTVTDTTSYLEAVRTITAAILTEWYENEHGCAATTTIRVEADAFQPAPLHP